jgi:hypothetical protein
LSRLALFGGLFVVYNFIKLFLKQVISFLPDIILSGNIGGNWAVLEKIWARFRAENKVKIVFKV